LDDDSPIEHKTGWAIAQNVRNPIELDENPGDKFIYAMESCTRENFSCHEADVIAHGRSLSTIDSDHRQSVVTKEALAQKWFTGLEAARRTLLATTQDGVHFVEGPIERRLRTSQAHMRFPSLIMTLCSDTLFSHVRSVRGFTCAQIFTDGHGFVRIYPMRSKSDAHHALMKFIHEVGVPKNLLTDRAQEEMRGEWGQIEKKYRIHQKTTESYSPWQNRAEGEIRELKKLTRRALRSNGTPNEFWCYAMEWAAKVRSCTAHDSIVLGSRTPEECITGVTPDISELIHFSWLQWIWYKEPTTFPEADVRLGKWMGVANDVGQAMTYWVLTDKKTIIARSSVAPLSDLDYRNPSIKNQLDEFNRKCHISGPSEIDIFPEVISEEVRHQGTMKQETEKKALSMF
jgi:hypothetical protein